MEVMAVMEETTKDQVTPVKVMAEAVEVEEELVQLKMGGLEQVVQSGSHGYLHILHSLIGWISDPQPGVLVKQERYLLMLQTLDRQHGPMLQVLFLISILE